MHIPPSPGEPTSQVSVHPQHDSGPREDGEEEGCLTAENRPEDTEIPDRREPGPIDQEAARQAQYDEGGQDDDNSDGNASSRHNPPPSWVRPRPGDRVTWVGHGQKETRTARSAGLQPEGEPRA